MTISDFSIKFAANFEAAALRTSFLPTRSGRRRAAAVYASNIQIYKHIVNAMNVTIDMTDSVSAVLNVSIEEADYKPDLELSRS